MLWEIELEAEYSLTLYIYPLWRMWFARQKAEVVDSECICSGNVLVQPAEDPHLQIIGSVPDS